MSGTGSLRRNGLVLFGSKIASVFTGLLFLLMVTRGLTAPRFGLWEVIIDLVTFASYPAGFLGFWASRDIARGRSLGKTLFLMNLGFSAVGIGLYGLFSLPVHGQLGAALGPFLLAVLLVPLAYWNQAAINVALGYRPAAAGYALMISEGAKLLVAFPALYIFKLELSGVILGLIASYFVSSSVIMYLTRGASREALDFQEGRRWARELWVPALNLLPAQLAIADTFVASFAAGSTLVTGYYQAAFQLGILVSYAGSLASALYPLLVRGGREDAPSVTLDLITMFALPMAAGMMVLAPTLLALLNPIYVQAGANVSAGVAILAAAGFVWAISLFADSTLMGVERVDADPNRTFRSYLRSNFLYVSAVNTVLYGVILSGVFVVVKLWAAGSVSLTQAVDLWAILQLCVFGPGVALKLRKAKRAVRVSVPRSLRYYLASTLVMVAALYGFSLLVPHATTAGTVLGVFAIASLATGAVSYFGALLALDKRARTLAAAFVGSLRP